MKSVWGGQGRDPDPSGVEIPMRGVQPWDGDSLSTRNGTGQRGGQAPAATWERGSAGEHVLRRAGACACGSLCTRGSDACAEGVRAPCGLGGARAAEVPSCTSSRAGVPGRTVPQLCHDRVPRTACRAPRAMHRVPCTTCRAPHAMFRSPT